MNHPIASNRHSPGLSRTYMPQILHQQLPPRISEAIPIVRNDLQIPNLNNKTASSGYQQVIEPSSGYQVPPYFLPPAYLVQPIPILRHSPQSNFTLNFDTESAHSLCEGKINENVIFCVVCQSQYRAIDHQQHINKHKRKLNFSPLRGRLTDKLDAHRKEIGKTNKEYIIKPIVEPEECTIQYQPKTYNFTKEVHYEDPSLVKQRSNIIAAQENSFSFYEHNITRGNSSINYVPNQSIKIEANPFNNKKTVLHPFASPFAPTLARQHGEVSKQSSDGCIPAAHEATLNKQQISFENGPIVCEPINNTRELVHRLQSFSDPIEVKDSFSKINGSITNLLKEESFMIAEK